MALLPMADDVVGRAPAAAGDLAGPLRTTICCHPPDGIHSRTV